MELGDEFGQFKSEFAKQIAMEEGKARNLNILMLKGQHSLKRGTSDSGLGMGRKIIIGQSLLNNSKLHGSAESLPSLISVGRDENWVTSEEFKDILELKEKEVSRADLNRLQEENAELRERLESAGRRNSDVSGIGRSKFQELERDVTKLQAKICKMRQSSEDPKSIRRLVTFLETFKAQLPMLPMDTSSECSYDSVLDRTDSYAPSNDSYQPSIASFGRPSMGSYKAACQPAPGRCELSRPLPGRADSCVAQFSRANHAAENRLEDADSCGALLGPDDWSSLQFDHHVHSTVCDSDDLYVKAFKPTRTHLNRSRVLMGAKTVQRAQYVGSMRGKSGRAFSSFNLLGEHRVRDEEFISSAEEVFVEKTHQSVNRSLKSRSKSYSNMLSSRDTTEISVKDTDGSSQSSYSKEDVKEDISTKVKVKDETKVQKFFKCLKNLVSKEPKVNDGEANSKVSRKMTRSLSHTIGKSKSHTKRLKSYHGSSPRLRKDLEFN